VPKNKSDDCMFCQKNPCECQSSRSQQMPKKTVSPLPISNLKLPTGDGDNSTFQSSPPPSDELSVEEAWKEALKKPYVVLPLAADIVNVQSFVYFRHEDPVKELPVIILSGDDADLRNAVQALAPLMSDADRAKYRDMIDPPVPWRIKERYKEWKSRNAR
jgi:hypothetical protein